MVEFTVCELGRTLHEEFGGLDTRAIPGSESGSQACRDAENANDKKDADRARVMVEPGRELLLGDEAVLEVVTGESVDTVDEVRQGR